MVFYEVKYRLVFTSTMNVFTYSGSFNLIYYVDDLACVAMKGVVSCDNLEVGAYFL